MNLAIGDSFSISDITRDDRAAYLEHLADKRIHDQTLNIPYPYTEADAEWWIQHVAEETKAQGRSVNWAIRRGDGYLVGGIGFHDREVAQPHRAELGYWLAGPYWNRGIMTNAVRRVSEYAFAELGLIRITAFVFHFNAGSARVLEKAGYQLEGRLRQHHKKGDAFLDSLVYGRLKAGGSAG